MTTDLTDPIPEIIIGRCRCKEHCGGVKLIIKNPQIADSGHCFAVIQPQDVARFIDSIIALYEEH